jgi:hypothetical protein
MPFAGHYYIRYVYQPHPATHSCAEKGNPVSQKPFSFRYFPLVGFQHIDTLQVVKEIVNVRIFVHGYRDNALQPHYSNKIIDYMYNFSVRMNLEKQINNDVCGKEPSYFALGIVEYIRVACAVYKCTKERPCDHDEINRSD